MGSNMRTALKALDCKVYGPTHFEYDLTKQDEVDDMYGAIKPTVVIHMAGLVGGIGANTARPYDFYYQNSMMGNLVIDGARQCESVQKIIAVAAGCGYPEQAPIPIQESSLWDGYPQWWSASYSLAKRMLVVQADALYRQYGKVMVVVMPGNLYGIADNFSLEDGHVIPALVRKFVEAVMFGRDEVVVWGSGKASRDFVYAADVCDGLIKVAEAYDKPELVNLSSGVESSIAEVVDLLVKITGFRGRVVWDRTKPDGQLRRCFDTSKAAGIGWRAKVGLEEGLGLTVAWFRENYERARK